jgi:hypothetical protein
VSDRKTVEVDAAPLLTGDAAAITEYYATGAPRVTQVRKFEVCAPFCPCHDDLDMRNAQELLIRYVEPRKRKWDGNIRLLHGTAVGYNNNTICYNDKNYMLIEHEGKVLFDSRTVFPVNMQQFARKREDYIAQMAARGFSRESLRLNERPNA